MVYGDLPAALREESHTGLADALAAREGDAAGEIGVRAVAGSALAGLGAVAAARGETEEAVRRMREALAFRTEIGERKGVADSRLEEAGALLDALVAGTPEAWRESVVDGVPAHRRVREALEAT